MWSPGHNLDHEGKAMVLAPDWAMGSKLMVDAHTGKLWRNGGSARAEDAAPSP